MNIGVALVQDAADTGPGGALRDVDGCRREWRDDLVAEEEKGGHGA